MNLELDLIWFWLAFGSMLANVGFFMVNQYAKQSGIQLVFFYRIWVLVILLPFAFWIDWPQDPIFYVMMLIIGCLSAFGDIKVLGGASKYGAGMVSRLMPYQIWVSFFLWFAFDWQLLLSYLEKPLLISIILICMSMTVYFSIRLTKCALSKEAMKEIVPAVLAYGIVLTLAKYALSLADPWHASLAYLSIQTCVLLTVTKLYATYKKVPLLLDLRSIKQGLFSPGVLGVMVFWFAHMLFKNHATILADNPGYINVVLQLSPIFIALIYAIIGHKEQNVDVKSGMGIVLSVLVLVTCTLVI